ncbi:hypothetical protein LTR40_006443, partial [Exophiala xenobiotica]
QRKPPQTRRTTSENHRKPTILVLGIAPRTNSALGLTNVTRRLTTPKPRSQQRKPPQTRRTTRDTTQRPRSRPKRQQAIRRTTGVKHPMNSGRGTVPKMSLDLGWTSVLLITLRRKSQPKRPPATRRTISVIILKLRLPRRTQPSLAKGTI